MNYYYSLSSMLLSYEKKNITKKIVFIEGLIYILLWAYKMSKTGLSRDVGDVSLMIVRDDG